MYDLINDWSELDSLSSVWKIHKHFDRELNEFEITLIRSIEDDEIFKFYVRFSVRCERALSSVYIDTFNTWSVGELNEGLKVLGIINSKVKEFEKWALENDFGIELGRI